MHLQMDSRTKRGQKRIFFSFDKENSLKHICMMIRVKSDKNRDTTQSVAFIPSYIAFAYTQYLHYINTRYFQFQVQANENKKIEQFSTLDAKIIYSIIQYTCTIIYYVHTYNQININGILNLSNYKKRFFLCVVYRKKVYNIVCIGSKISLRQNSCSIILS